MTLLHGDFQRLFVHTCTTLLVLDRYNSKQVALLWKDANFLPLSALLAGGVLLILLIL